jgi:hypothetical protein
MPTKPARKLVKKSAAKKAVGSKPKKAAPIKVKKAKAKSAKAKKPMRAQKENSVHFMWKLLAKKKERMKARESSVIPADRLKGGNVSSHPHGSSGFGRFAGPRRRAA